MKTLALCLLLTVSSYAGTAKLEAGKYKIDPAHSKVGFEVTHLVISTVDGQFKNFSGTLNIDKNFAKSSVEAEVDVNSIDTAVADRDKHLKSADFFEAEKYPKMTFKSTSISGDEKSFKMTGDLNLKGTTKKVTFNGSYKGTAVDVYGNTKSAFEAKATISRKDYGLAWNKMVEVGPIVGDEITIILKVQLTKEK